MYIQKSLPTHFDPQTPKHFSHTHMQSLLHVCDIFAVHLMKEFCVYSEGYTTCISKYPSELYCVQPVSNFMSAYFMQIRMCLRIRFLNFDEYFVHSAQKPFR
jgi:hypothetical protein